MDSGREGCQCHTERMQEKIAAGQEGCRTGVMQDCGAAGQVGCRTIEGCRKGEIQ